MFEDYTETDADELYKTFREETKEEKELREFDMILSGASRHYLFKTMFHLQEHLKQVENNIKLCNNVLNKSEELLILENKTQNYYKIRDMLLGAIGGNVATIFVVCAEKALNNNLDIGTLFAQQSAMMAGGVMMGYLYYKAFKQKKYKQEKQNNIDWINGNQKRVLDRKNCLEEEERKLHKKYNILQKHIDASNTKEMINKEGFFQVAITDNYKKM